MNTLNEKGMARLQDWLRIHAKHPPANSVQLDAWASEAEQSNPPHVEIRARESVHGWPVTLSFSQNEYFINVPCVECGEVQVSAHEQRCSFCDPGEGKVKT